MKMLCDPVKLVFCCQPTEAEIERLDLTLLQEVKRGKDGAVEVKLVDKVKLAELAGEMKHSADTEAFDKLIAALHEVGKALR